MGVPLLAEAQLTSALVVGRRISMMHTELVERRRWISEHRFLHALNYTMVLPGPERSSSPPYRLADAALGGIMAVGTVRAAIVGHPDR